jgi:hypothetical protein
MSWAAPANRGDLLFLEPSLRYLRKRLDFSPSFVVADMAYISMARQRRLREQLQIGIVTGLPPNFDLPKSIEPALLMRCRQGQKLQWLGLRENEQLHWFGVAPEPEPLCIRCWERSSCPQEFCFAPSDHEIALGTIPLNTLLAKRLLRQSRSWIEATQSYEKNQLGLSQMFLNSLRLTSILCHLSDTISLLRAHAYLRDPEEPQLLEKLLPSQLNLGLE